MTDAPAHSAASGPPAPLPYGAPSAVRRSPRLGQVAAIIGIAVFVISIAVSVLIGIAAAPHVQVGPGGFNANFSANDPDPAVRALAFGSFAHIALGGLFGTWAIVRDLAGCLFRSHRRERLTSCEMSCPDACPPFWGPARAVEAR
jgi:hypothetical protein